MNERETAVHFYEMLTGVFNDEQSKVIRYVCFAALSIGIAWAGFNYFRTTVLADTKIPIDEGLFQTPVASRNDAAIQRVVDLARTIDTMRSAGSSIAATISGIHNMPFNTDPETIIDPFDTAPIPADVPQVQEAPSVAPMTVRMIMTADDGQRIAVVDAGGKKAVVLRRGDEIPGGGGFVRAIRPDGITVIVNKQEVKYEVPEIPIFTEIKSTRRK